MKDTDRQTRSRLMDLFAERGIHPRTDLGQNFLIDLNLVDYVVQQAELGPRDVALEIGTGTGGMTMFMADQAAAVVTVEIDSQVFEFAKRNLAGRENVTLLNVDALKNKNRFHPDVLAAVERELAVDPRRRLKLVANLPYNVATPVISNLVASELPWSRMVVTIQRELAEKMVARHGGGKYGALAVWLQAQCDVRILRRLGNTVFWPRPKVDSAIVRLSPKPSARERIADRVFFQDFVRRVFHHRRKLLRPVLVNMYRKELEKAEIDALLAERGFGANARAEELPIATHVELANRFHEKIGARGA